MTNADIKGWMRRLAETEYWVYVCLVNHGQSTARQIADNSRYSVSTVYRTVKLLMEKGLIQKEGNKYMVASE